KKYNIDAEYKAFEVKEDEAEDFFKIKALKLNLLGINVTMPLKDIAAQYVKALDRLSSKIKSVNTVDIVNMKGYTTDGGGLLLSLSYNGIDINDKSVCIIGAGGAAKSVALALQPFAKSIFILNRTAQKASGLAQLTGANARGFGLENASLQFEDCDVLINCSKMGMCGDNSLINGLDSLKKNAFVYDIVYEPRETPLLKWAKENGFKYCNGLDMLICQALLAFEIYTGIKPCKQDRDELLKVVK
ncbi:MAG: shikimate dehydrogenase, partial [Clostridia bacterium]|nr:shikimate dehydrogenase [Clostridia bacterium]